MLPKPLSVSRSAPAPDGGSGAAARLVMGRTLRLQQLDSERRPVSEVALLARAALRLCTRLKPGDTAAEEASASVGVVHTVALLVRNTTTPYPQFGMDESYQVAVAAPVVTIEANTVWGAMRCGRRPAACSHCNTSHACFLNACGHGLLTRVCRGVRALARCTGV